ncbi:alpha/beta-hydrolase [Cadophora sp. DSE1049]|nr:alpha/beta-hydrolase [Cadophora sp. DSE1049]
MPGQFVMDSQKYEDVCFNEKAGFLDDETSLSNQDQCRLLCKAHLRSIRWQGFKNVVYLLLFVSLWGSFTLIPNPLKWYGRAIVKGTQERHLSFDTITPSERLEWEPCFYDNMRCARLTVPMDYNRPLNASADNPKVHIALVLVPGKHQGTQQASTSPLVLNPGGPGGSGAQFALMAGTMLQKIVGEEQDIIGFDPRGIGATTPRADCFAYPLDGSNNDPSEASSEDYIRGNFHRTMWQTAGRDVGTVNSSTDTLQKLDIRARTMAKLCGEKDAVYRNNSILKYVHTPSVAHDMLSIVDAWDEWRARIGDSDDTEIDELKPREDDGPDQPTTSLDTKGKLVYWGFSYGTLLGATFAAMFPDRVGRVILDGVVDADHYVSPVWRGSIQDADKISTSFSFYCHKAEGACALYRSGDEVSDVEDRFQAVIDRIKENPVTLIHPMSKQPIVITNSHIRMILFSILYNPNVGFSALAWIFDMLSRGDDEILGQIIALPEPEPFCAANLPAELFPNEAQIAIMCSDKRYPFNDSLPELQETFEKMANESSWADVWMTIMIACDAYPVKAVDPPMRWDDHPSHKADPIKTSFPLLFVSNTADPVTPLAAGVKMARKFVDAGLVEQHSMGHCSIAAVSKCSIGKIRAYLREGKVPPHPVKGGKGRELVDGKWTKCDAEQYPFHPYEGDVMAAQSVEAAMEIERMNAMKKVQNVFSKMKAWGQDQPLDLDMIMPRRCGSRS